MDYFPISFQGLSPRPGPPYPRCVHAFPPPHSRPCFLCPLGFVSPAPSFPVNCQGVSTFPWKSVGTVLYWTGRKAKESLAWHGKATRSNSPRSQKYRTEPRDAWMLHPQSLHLAAQLHGAGPRAGRRGRGRGPAAGAWPRTRTQTKHQRAGSFKF